MRSRENNLFIFCCFFFTRGVNLHGAWNYGDVKRALRGCGNRGDRCIFEPEVGKVFESTEEAFEFYNMYSWEIGVRHKAWAMQTEQEWEVYYARYCVCLRGK